jgi:hypothetical protein
MFIQMRIELITMWYNEEFFAPFFLNHYSWVDKIHIIIDADTNDNTVEIARKYSNVEIEYFKFPDMMNDSLKVNKFNQKYKSLHEADYVILVDSDEFIYCNDTSKSLKTHLEETSKDIYFTHLWQIYQHESDFQLDSNMPVPLQRRHGDPEMDGFNINYVKPIVVKSGLDIRWECGNHSLWIDGFQLHFEQFLIHNIEMITMLKLNISIEKHEMLQGSHWRLVDLQETIRRRILNRKLRQSKHNLATGQTKHYHSITEDEIIQEYTVGKKFPIVINSTGYHAIDRYLQIVRGNQDDESQNSMQIDAAKTYYDICKGYVIRGEFYKAFILIQKAIILNPYNIFYCRLADELNMKVSESVRY